MITYHTTLKRNLASILSKGLLCSKSKQARKAVWMHSEEGTAWAFLHVVRRHGGRIQDVVCLEIEVDEAHVKYHKGGLMYQMADVPPSAILRITTYSAVSRSPVESEVSE